MAARNAWSSNGLTRNAKSSALQCKGASRRFLAAGYHHYACPRRQLAQLLLHFNAILYWHREVEDYQCDGVLSGVIKEHFWAVERLRIQSV